LRAAFSTFAVSTSRPWDTCWAFCMATGEVPCPLLKQTDAVIVPSQIHNDEIFLTPQHVSFLLTCLSFSIPPVILLQENRTKQNKTPKPSTFSFAFRNISY
jgi:hypothetical protein